MFAYTNVQDESNYIALLFLKTIKAKEVWKRARVYVCGCALVTAVCMRVRVCIRVRVRACVVGGLVVG